MMNNQLRNDEIKPNELMTRLRFVNWKLISSFWFTHSSFTKPLSKHQLSQFCSHLSLLLSSGVPLLEALTIVKRLSKIKGLDDMVEKINHGQSFADALGERFPPMLVSSVAAAERSGSLEEVLQQLAKYYEGRAEAEDKIKSALIYPTFVILLCFISLAMIFLFVLPGFSEMFADLEVELPLFTQGLLMVGSGLASYWYLFLFIILVGGYLSWRYVKTSKGKEKLYKTLLRSKLYTKTQIAQVFRTLGSMLAGGVPIIEALNHVVGSIKNICFRQTISELSLEIENGAKMSELLSKNKLFPLETSQMIAVGENTGRLDQMLLNVADLFERERELFIKRFTTMLEPALTLFVGLIVGLIAISMFMPMIDMISKLE